MCKRSSVKLDAEKRRTHVLKSQAGRSYIFRLKKKKKNPRFEEPGWTFLSSGWKRKKNPRFEEPGSTFLSSGWKKKKRRTHVLRSQARRSYLQAEKKKRRTHFLRSQARRSYLQAEKKKKRRTHVLKSQARRSYLQAEKKKKEEPTFWRSRLDVLIVRLKKKKKEEPTFLRARLEVLIFRLRSYHVLFSYIADGNGRNIYKTLTSFSQAGTFLSFHSRRSLATSSSTSDLTVFLPVFCSLIGILHRRRDWQSDVCRRQPLRQPHQPLHLRLRRHKVHVFDRPRPVL